MAASDSFQLTFLFTDIEGSTRLWEDYPVAMARALMRHDAILRSQIAAHGGRVFKTVGDAFCAVFPESRDAVLAGVDILRELEAEPWEETGPLRVRMAVHCGTPSQREGDYFGPPVNCVARLLHAGYGGQFLISAAVASRVADSLPDLVNLVDLGTHRLRDVKDPMRVFQVAAAGLAQHFPPIRTLEYDPHNIPAQMSSFIGRHHELADILEVLRQPDIRLVTLTGPGGVGKTRLAMQVAMQARKDFPDGRYLVSLASLIDAGAVTGTILRDLGVPDAPDAGEIDRLVDFLRHKQMLLVLDNFEHVLDASDVVLQVLTACAGITLLVTSRIPLHVYGEHEYPVVPFVVPDVNAPEDVGAIATNEAVTLFCDRARAVRSGFSLTPGNATDIAEICSKLDGLPLGIELAAARSKLLSPQALLERLSGRLSFLEGHTRGVPERQQTIRATIQWSYDLLAPQERALLRWLTVFAGGFTSDAAEQLVTRIRKVRGDSPDFPIPDAMTGIELLIDNSLIRVQESGSGEPRLMILETVREFGHDQMRVSREMEAVQREHAAWCTDLAITARAAYTRPDETAWLDRLVTEHDNLRAALTWLGRQVGREDLSQARLAANLWWFWLHRRYASEGREWLRQAIGHAEGAAPGDIADALNGAGVLAYMQADNRLALMYFRRCLEMRREHGTPRDLSSVLNNLGNVLRSQGELDEAIRSYQEAADVARSGGEQRILGTMLSNLGNVLQTRGEYERAIQIHHEALAVQLEQGHLRGANTTRGNLGDTCVAAGRFEEAHKWYQMAADEFVALGDVGSAAHAWLGMGVVACYLHDLDMATEHVNRAIPEFEKDVSIDSLVSARMLEARVAFEQGNLQVCRAILMQQIDPVLQLGEDERLVLLIEWLARVALSSGDAALAARWFGSADALREREVIYLMQADEPEREATYQKMKDLLGNAVYDYVRSEGANLTLHGCLDDIRAWHSGTHRNAGPVSGGIPQGV